MKKQSAMHVVGFQTVILSCFLPALLYGALLSLPVESLQDTVHFPLTTILYMAFLIVGFKLLVAATRFTNIQAELSSLCLMFPGLAPGLSSLPFMQSFVADIPPRILGVGHVGLADLGVKFVVCFLCYIIAWWMTGRRYRASNSAFRASNSSFQGVELPADTTACSTTSWAASQFFQLSYGYFAEPVNSMSILALCLLVAGPVRLEDQWLAGRAASFMAGCCTPSVFILIGLKLQGLKRHHLGLLALMAVRSGLALVFVSLLRHLRGIDMQETMFWIMFCNSSVSFWPYTHIANFAHRERINMSPVLVRYLSVLYDAIRDNREKWKPDAEDEVSARLDDLGIVMASLEEGAIDVECAIRKSTAMLACLVKLVDLAVVSDGMKTLGTVQFSTFSESIAIALLMVSFTWTIAFVMAVSCVPPMIWETRGVLEVVGVIFIVVGAAYLRVQAGRAGMEKAREEAEGAEEANEVQCREAKVSICSSIDIDCVTMAEADMELRRASMVRGLEPHEVELAVAAARRSILWQESTETATRNEFGSVDLPNLLRGSRWSTASVSSCSEARHEDEPSPGVEAAV